MGWTSSRHWRTPKDVHRHVLSERYFGAGWTILAHASTSLGRHLWVAIQNPEGKKFLGLWLIEKHDGECAYKDMTEDMGPAYYDCPLYMLDMVPEPPGGEYAKQWRKLVRAHHEHRRQQWAPGEKCLIYGKEYTVAEPYKRSYIVVDANGQRFRGSPAKMQRP